MTPISLMRRMSWMSSRLSICFLHAAGVVAGDEQMLLDGFAPSMARASSCCQHAQDAVRVARLDTSGLVTSRASSGKVHGHEGAALDVYGRVANDVLEVHCRRSSSTLPAFQRERVLVAGLAGGQHEQVVAVLVLDECLVQVGFTLDDVDQVVPRGAHTP